MAYNAKILLDSVAPDGTRLTTFEITYPRMVHAERLRHRSASCNVGSSRAMPIAKIIQAVLRDPVIPVWWGAHQKGMVAQAELTGWRRRCCEKVWRGARYGAVAIAWGLLKLGMHKQIPNRVLEPWVWVTEILTATQDGFANFFNLRCAPDAQPEIRVIAEMMARCYAGSTPNPLQAGEWHLPLTGFPGDEALSLDDLLNAAVGRLARVSYLTHDGKRDPAADIALCEQLARNGHMSPFEHCAQARWVDPEAIPTKRNATPWVSGNFVRGWIQYRKLLEDENRTEWKGLPEG